MMNEVYYEMERNLLAEIESEKKFTLHKLLKIIELSAMTRPQIF